ncbi:MAG: hypothetical protein ACI9MC_001812 [Kiritimatiellia bacterium]
MVKVERQGLGYWQLCGAKRPSVSGTSSLNGGVDVDLEERPKLVPLLRPGEYSAQPGEYVRPLVQAHGDKQWLWVTLAFDMENSLEPARAEQVGDVDAALSDALDRMSAGVVDWDEECDDRGVVRALLGMGDLASERLLCPKLMREAAAQLGVQAIAVAVPVHGLIRVQSAFPKDPSPITSLLSWAELACLDAQDQPTMIALTPVVFVVTDGVISGLVRGVSIEETAQDVELAPLRAGEVRAERKAQAAWWRRMFSKKG